MYTLHTMHHTCTNAMHSLTVIPNPSLTRTQPIYNRTTRYCCYVLFRSFSILLSSECFLEMCLLRWAFVPKARGQYMHFSSAKLAWMAFKWSRTTCRPGYSLRHNPQLGFPESGLVWTLDHKFQLVICQINKVWNAWSKERNGNLLSRLK